MRVALVMAGFLLSLVLVFSAPAQEERCVKCHKHWEKGKVLHSAVEMGVGCTVCHAGIISKYMPHKNSNARAKGLAAAQPELCYSCHDKAPFTKTTVHAALGTGCTSCHDPHSADRGKLLVEGQEKLCHLCHNREPFAKKTVHAALGMGCTACHDPHSSDRDKVLVSGEPELCYSCHDKGPFTKTTVHPALWIRCTTCHDPHSADRGKLLVTDQAELCYACHDKAPFTRRTVHAALGMGCTTCHSPHASDEMALLMKQPQDLCLECHNDVLKRPHVVSGLSTSGHPLGEPKTSREGMAAQGSVLRPDRIFYCGSCHDPHSSDTPTLFRFNARTPEALCAGCHAKGEKTGGGAP
jgi:predicted CXXCH cytochrome family protein